MPRSDGTGPMSAGIKAGKGLCHCQCLQNSNKTRLGLGQGARRGLGKGLGRQMFGKK